MPNLSEIENTFIKSGALYDIIRCYNPTDEDFSFSYLDDSNREVFYEIKAGEIKEWPRYIVSHYAKHMVDKLLTQGGYKTNLDHLRTRNFNLIVGEDAGRKPVVMAVEKEEPVTVEQPKPNRGGRPRKQPVEVPETNFSITSPELESTETASNP